MNSILLSDKDLSTIQSLLKEIISQYHSVEDPNFLREATLFTHDLPRGVRKFINDFKLLE